MFPLVLLQLYTDEDPAKLITLTLTIFITCRSNFLDRSSLGSVHLGTQKVAGSGSRGLDWPWFLILDLHP
jgi:hypothetical protein